MIQPQSGRFLTALEETALAEDGQVLEEDGLAQQWDYLRRHPINLNRADIHALQSLPGITPLQAARRELKEETGLEGKLELVGVKHKMDYSQKGNLLEDKYFFVFPIKSRLVG